MTGSFAPGVALAGRHTFRNRQSSDGACTAGAPAGGAGAGAGAPARAPALGGGPPPRPCIQFAPNSAAWRTPVHGAAGWGGLHRRSPTGGAAKGMPLKDVDAVVSHTLQFAAFHPDDRARLRRRRRLQRRGGADTHRHRQRRQRAPQQPGHPRSRPGSVATSARIHHPFSLNLLHRHGNPPHFFGGASTPDMASTPAGRRAPWISIADTAAFSSESSAGVNRTAAAPVFSIMCAICVVPGMGTIQGFCAINHARAIWAGVARLGSAHFFRRSTSARL